ncbi:U3 small nucleolar RNA-associated protein 15 homolog [Penaeus chinensis]|uniref:U3 small nucleolar RNA-associated protein 15 homolog n=1 Tax=Penaeus chinensis TaxID=139456 RepID=UPI001FB7E7D0|nr:U3 small nucleolar RNA-associated protein 15 homolog [Penaeus chinensis]
MATFKKTHTRAFNKTGIKATADLGYWKKLEFPVTVKEFTSIDYVDVSPTEPYYIAVTSGPKVDVYHQQTTQVWRTISRFQRNAYGARFRQDGQLLVVGTEEGQVRLFNQRQKQLLRVFKGHSSATHRVGFVEGTSHIVSFSDDQTAVLWDIGDESQICTLKGHTDFIRAGITSPASENIILSGSYDHTVRLWDTRTGSSVLTVDHGAPVESILCYPSGGVFISAGGSEVRVWDTISGRLLSKLSQHHKTVTCLSFASDNNRLMSGSLDCHIKIYDVNTYSVVHTLDFPAPILSMAVAPEDSMLAVGMISGGSGLVSFQHRREQQEVEKDSNKAKRKAADIRNMITEDYRVVPDEQIIRHEEKEQLSKYDVLLRKFKYSQALDTVLTSYVTSKTPNVTVGVLHELIRREGLKTAIAGREVKQLVPLLNFVIRYVRNPLYKQLLLDVSNVIIDLYSDSLHENPALVRQFRRLQDEIAAELRISREYIGLMGAIEMFLSASEPERVPSTLNPQHLASTSTYENESSGNFLQSSPKKSSAAVVVDVV